MDKTLLSGSTALLILKLLEDGDKYGYQMIEELRRRSDDTFSLKAGTLYPLLHSLEQKGCITAWEETGDSARPRRYYHLTEEGSGEGDGVADLRRGHAPCFGGRRLPCLRDSRPILTKWPPPSPGAGPVPSPSGSSGPTSWSKKTPSWPRA